MKQNLQQQLPEHVAPVAGRAAESIKMKSRSEGIERQECLPPLLALNDSSSSTTSLAPSSPSCEVTSKASTRLVRCCFPLFKDRGHSPVYSECDTRPHPAVGPPPAACAMIIRMLMILSSIASAGEPSSTATTTSRSNARNAQRIHQRMGYVRPQQDVMQRRSS